MQLVYLPHDDTYYGEHTRVSRAAFEAAVARLVAGGVEARLAGTRLLDELAWMDQGPAQARCP